jgi:CRISPR/Cas system-associated exonuclease Cas4 (RecB family)
MIKRWMSCPLQVKLAQEHDVPTLVSGNMAFGTAIHSALEAYNEGLDVDTTVNFFLKSWENPELVNNEIDYWFPRTSWGSFRERGIQIINEYHLTRQWDARKIVGTEHRFCVSFGNHMLSGIVDYLEYEVATGTLYVIDLKSGRRPNKDQLHVDPQFSSYLWAVQQREFWVGNPDEGERYAGFENGEELFTKFRDSTHVGIWYDLQNNKEYDVGPRSDQDFARLHHCCDEIEKAILNNVYVPDISGDTCKWCDFKEVCPGYVMPVKNEE